MCKLYVTRNILDCVYKNGNFPQDVQISGNLYVTFGRYGLTVTKYTSKAIKVKHLNHYFGMNAEEINAALDEIKWEDGE